MMKRSISLGLVLIVFTSISMFWSKWASGQKADFTVQTTKTKSPRTIVWPKKNWATATPESQGLSPNAADAAAAYATKHGGGSGCIIRHGYLVKQWGSTTRRVDIKSATKGSFGTTALGLAIDQGLVKIDDHAQKHYPKIGQEKKENLQKGWLGDITIRHLATMSAGFDDGRPPRLKYKPGTSGIYSNDTSNMLAELLTIKFGKDLQNVIKSQVMDPIGADPKTWAWRNNGYRAKKINGLTSREFASGITITHQTLARIGYLYLHEGQWNGKQILSQKFIRQATQPTKLPTFVPYYAFYWGSNGNGTYPAMPKDTYWAMGLGDSFVLVCPSLDIVLVRLGTGSRRSQLPGGDKPGQWGARVESLFKMIVEGVNDQPVQKSTDKKQDKKQSQAPYPPSRTIRSITWAPKKSILRKAKGGDNWPITWADNGNIYTAYGDGNGFKPNLRQKLSLGIAKVIGGATNFRGVNVRSASGEQIGDGAKGKKASGLLMVNGVLYMWARNAANAQLAWSKDHGKSWVWSDWKLTKSFGYPTFLNFGKNYSFARDDYVYIYSHDNNSAYKPADRMVMARVPKTRIAQRDAYEFFCRLDKNNKPIWTKDISQRGAVFSHQKKCYRCSLSYNDGLKRYLWCQIIPGGDTRYQGGFGIYDAPQPWGPWTTVFYTEAWDTGPGETSCIPTKWISRDGKTIHLIFSGNDCFSVRKAILNVSPNN